MSEAKVCKGCLKEYPATKEYFFTESKNKDGLKGMCKDCIRKQKKQYAEANKEKLTEYYKMYNQQHKEEIAKYNKQYIADNRECRNEYRREYSKRQHTKELRKVYLEKSKNKRSETMRKYFLNNQNNIKKYMKQYNQENKQYSVMSSQKRRTRKLMLPDTLTLEDWETIREKFNNKCAYCGRELKLEQEHFVSLTNGGEYTINNIIPACKSCNSSKNDKNFFEWYPTYKYYSKKRERFILDYLNYKNNIQQLTLAI
jgi:5-methylcytosine-specific restriction endonuclease McrA